MGKLTPKQENFCNEYLIDLNATQAAIRAGYSVKTANRIASQNLSKLVIQDFIQEAQKKSSENAGITREMILEGYKKLAFYDMRKFYDAEDNLIPITELDDETAFALAGFEVMEEKDYIKGVPVVIGHTKKIKISDRRLAMDSIRKMLGYDSPIKIAQTDKDGNDIKVTLNLG
jgi:phage terminase small subunit